MINFVAIAFGTRIIVEESLKNHHSALEQAVSALELGWPFQRDQDFVVEKE